MQDFGLPARVVEESMLLNFAQTPFISVLPKPHSIWFSHPFSLGRTRVPERVGVSLPRDWGVSTLARRMGSWC